MNHESVVNKANQKIADQFQQQVLLYGFEYSMSKQSKKVKVKYWFDKSPGAKFKYAAVKRALSKIKLTELNLTKEEDIQKFAKYPGIGAGTLKHIREINKTGMIEFSPESRVLLAAFNELTSIYGIGYVKAFELINQNITTVAELKEAVKSGKVDVNNDIRLGLKYSSKFKEHIPRAEMDQHVKTLKNIFKLHKSIDSIEVMGSYRRGLSYSNDIDCLIAGSEGFNYFPQDNGYIVDVISGTKYRVGHKVFCFCQLPGKPVRRLDLMFVNEKEYPFALMYFTGSKYFNQKVRKIAMEKGFRLNEHYLLNIRTQKPVSGIKTEEDIFKKLKIAFVKPKDRT